MIGWLEIIMVWRYGDSASGVESFMMLHGKEMDLWIMVRTLRCGGTNGR